MKMKSKNQTIWLATGFFLILVTVGLSVFSYVFAQNGQHNEEVLLSCVAWVHDFEEEPFFEDVTTTTLSAKAIHFWHLLAHSYGEDAVETPSNFFPQRAIGEGDFINMLQNFNGLTNKQRASWFTSLLSKKPTKKLMPNSAVRFAGGIFKLPHKKILAEFRRVHPRGKWILRHEATQALYQLVLKALPESPEQSLCQKWFHDDAETFNEMFGPEEMSPPVSSASMSTSNGTTSDVSTITLPTTSTSTPSISTTPASTAAPVSPETPVSPGTSTQSVTMPALPTVSDSPPTILSITPYAPISLNQHFISSITLQWSAVANSTGVPTYYRAWRRFGSEDWLLWGQTQQTTFYDLNIGRGTYSYRVNACATGTLAASYGLVTSDCGPDSNIMTAILAGGDGNTSDTTPPSTPTDLKAWPDPYNRNFMSWTVSTDNVGVAGYNIYRNGIYLKSVCCTPAEDDFLFSSSTPFSYTVAAYDAAGNISAQSAGASVTMQ